MTEGGEPRPLVRDTRIKLAFGDEGEQGGLGWKAGCNSFGADVEITDDRLLVGQITGTAIGCSDDLEEQDEWVMGFFERDPTWRLSDDRLTLSSEETVVELEGSGP